MSTLILAHKRIFYGQFPQLAFVERFHELNGRGMLSLLLLGIFSACITVYLIGLFVSFNLGFGIQQKNAKFEKLNKAVLEQELALQESRALLDVHQIAVLESMEKVSAIKYLQPENVAVKSLQLHPY